MDDKAKLLGESKNVAKLSKTSQLTDFMEYAKQEGYQMELWVRSSTKLTPPLLEAIDKFKVILKKFPW